MNGSPPALDRLSTLTTYHAVLETEGPAARAVRQQVLLLLADIRPEEINPTLRYFVQECLGPPDLVGIRWTSARQVIHVARCLVACSSRPVWESYQPGSLLYELIRQSLVSFAGEKAQEGRFVVQWLGSLALLPPLLARPGPYHPPRALLGVLLAFQIVLLFLGFPFLLLEAEQPSTSIVYPPSSLSVPHPAEPAYLDALTWTLLTPIAQAEESRLPQSQTARRLTTLAGGTKLLVVSTLARLIHLHSRSRLFALNPQLTHLHSPNNHPRYPDDEDEASHLRAAHPVTRIAHTL